MSETVQVGDAADLICDLKAAVTALECQYKMNLLEEQSRRKEKKSRSPPPPPMFMMIPIEQMRNDDENKIREDRTRRKRDNRHERDSDSYNDSITSSDCRRTNRRRDECEESSGPRMRGGVLHSRCGCIHRDGLQDSCPLTECQDQPDCRTKPWATCPPAKYFRSRFPDIWPPPATDAITF